MREELRLSPRSPGARSWGRPPGGGAVPDGVKVNRRLSTGFAGRRGVNSTGPVGARRPIYKEVVG